MTTLPDVPASYGGRWVRSEELPGGRFLVPGRIPFGIWSHAAPPATYKSAVASQIEHHISYGTPLPGLDWEFTVKDADCLVIVPDESIYDIQERSLRIVPGGELDTDTAQVDPIDYRLPDIHYRHEPGTGSVDYKLAWLILEVEKLQEATGRPCPWIRWDTLGNLLMEEQNGRDAYVRSMPLQPMNMWCATYGHVLFLPNHIGASTGRAIGTVGIAASSNLVTVTERTRNNPNTGTLMCTQDGGKMRGGAPWEAALEMRNGLLHLTDLHPQQTHHGLGTLPRRVVDFLVDHGASTIAEILQGTSIDQSVLWPVMMRLKTKGSIFGEDSRWALTDKGRISDPEEKPAEEPAQPLPDAPYQFIEPPAVAIHVGNVFARATDQPQLFTSSNPYATITGLSDAPPPPLVPAAGYLRSLELIDSMGESVTIKAAAEEEVEQWPDIDTGSPAISQMIEVLKASSLYPRLKMPGVIKTLLGYESVCLGGAPNGWQWFPSEAPAGRVLVLDRRGAFFQSCKCWLVPNVLHREADIDYHDVTSRNLAGMFDIVAPRWDAKCNRPHPLGGRISAGQRTLVPRPVLDRLIQVARAGFCEEPVITYGLVGKGSESLLIPWAKWCLANRSGTTAEINAAKTDQSQAISCMRIIDPEKKPGPVDRWDWQYAIHGHHYSAMNRYAYNALDAGDPLIALGNTDEIVFSIPEGADDTWLPSTLKEHVLKARFSVKGRRDGADWFANPRNLDRRKSA
jgi:hypothetical protein